MSHTEYIQIRSLTLQNKTLELKLCQKKKKKRNCVRFLSTASFSHLSSLLICWLLFPPCYSSPISSQVTLDFLSKHFSYSIPFSIILFQHHSLPNSQIALAISCLVYDMSSINNFHSKIASKLIFQKYNSIMSPLC